MKKLLGILALGLILNSCVPSSSPPNKKVSLNLSSSNTNYRVFYPNPWHNINDVKKIAYGYMPYGMKSFAISTAIEKNSDYSPNEIKPRNLLFFYVGYAHNPELAIKRTMEFCNGDLNQWKNKNILGLEIPVARAAKKSECRPVTAQTFLTEKKTSEQIKKEMKILSNQQNCKKLGLKENSKNFRNCIKEFQKAESKIIENDNISIFEVMVALLLLDSSISSTQTSTTLNPVCFLSSVAMTGSGGLQSINCY